MNTYRNQDVTLFATTTTYSGTKNDVSDTLQYSENIVLTKDAGINLNCYYREISPGSITDDLKIDIYRTIMIPFETGKHDYVDRISITNPGYAAGERIKSHVILISLDGPGCYILAPYSSGGTDTFALKIVGRYF